MTEYVIRFLVGGLAVSAFAVLGDVLRPKSFAGLSGKASVRVDALRYRKSEMREVLAQIEVKEDQVTLTQARLTAFGGRVSADGTRLALAHPDEPFRIAAQLQGIEVGEAVGLFAPGKVVSGKFDGKVDLSGGGTGKPDLASTLAGILGGQLAEGAFHGKDLVAGVAGPLAKALPGGLGKQIPSGGGSTPLGKNLPFSLKFRDGVAELEKPLRVSTSQGDLTLGGGFRVDGTLDMAGTVSLAPQTVASLTGGRVRPQAAIPVTFKMTGPAWRPSLGSWDFSRP